MIRNSRIIPSSYLGYAYHRMHILSHICAGYPPLARAIDSNVNQGLFFFFLFILSDKRSCRVVIETILFRSPWVSASDYSFALLGYKAITVLPCLPVILQPWFILVSMIPIRNKEVSCWLFLISAFTLLKVAVLLSISEQLVIVPAITWSLQQHGMQHIFFIIYHILICSKIRLT